jgi:phage virion morphogenesis protein
MSQIEGIDRLFNRIRKLSADSKHVERPLKASGVYMLGSIERNFKASGRPAKWQALAPGTLRRRRKGKGKGGAKILVDTARLKNSMQTRLVSDGVQIGTNTVYAGRHHFGYPGGTGRGRSKTPARPFLMFQNEDLTAIGQIFKRHIERG